MPYRIAVISPDGAAGLGDFKKTVGLLDEPGLMEIRYLTAMFEGEQAAGQLLSAFKRAAMIEDLDALVVIRGGGAAASLQYLSDLELARAIANFHVPVITGIGHEQDLTILDEVAYLNCGTPSKAAQYIFSQVAGSIESAIVEYESVLDLAGRGLDQSEDARCSYVDVMQRRSMDLQRLAANDLALAVHGVNAFAGEQCHKATLVSQSVMTLIHSSGLSRLTEADLRMSSLESGLKQSAADMLNESVQAVNSLVAALPHRASACQQSADLLFNRLLSTIPEAASQVTSAGEHVVSGLMRDIHSQGAMQGSLSSVHLNHIERETHTRACYQLDLAKQGMQTRISAVEQQAKIHCDTSVNLLAGFMGIFDAYSPRRVLARGYALIRAEDGSVLRERQKIEQSACLSIEVADGIANITLD